MTNNAALRRTAVVVGGAAAALAAWVIESPVLGTDLTVRPNSKVGPAAVVAVALIVGLAGWGLLALLERTTRKARVIWTVIASVVLAVSLLGPLGGISAGAKVALLVLHLTVGLGLILALPRAKRARTA
jgi:hypothetical protein